MSNESNKIREGKIDHVNPLENGAIPPGKKLKSQVKPDIKESGLGREVSQSPADEHMEHRLSQIDPETVQLQQSKSESGATGNNRTDQS